MRGRRHNVANTTVKLLIKREDQGVFIENINRRMGGICFRAPPAFLGGRAREKGKKNVGAEQFPSEQQRDGQNSGESGKKNHNRQFKTRRFQDKKIDDGGEGEIGHFEGADAKETGP